MINVCILYAIIPKFSMCSPGFTVIDKVKIILPAELMYKQH